MALRKKTTILFSPDLYQQLVKLARERHTSVGNLVRTACEERYGRVSAERRMAAARELSRFSLPVGSVAKMKRESIPWPKDPPP